MQLESTKVIKESEGSKPAACPFFQKNIIHHYYFVKISWETFGHFQQKAWGFIRPLRYIDGAKVHEF